MIIVECVSGRCIGSDEVVMGVVAMLEDVEGVSVVALPQNTVTIWAFRFDKRFKTTQHRLRSKWRYQIMKDFDRLILF